ncbi:hypothetical protein ACFY5F_39570 [Streptomyces sp. NPDC013161]|uniref:hypothetical protein n=1 Tax=Streptomyces sp. NPDC013161 TaxID=3364862 RepID=UPI0036C4FD93
MFFRARNLLFAGLAVFLGAAIAVPLAVADDSSASAADTPPIAVEQFSYPGAAGILTSEGIELKKGDGHILLATCDGSADQIRIYTVKDSTVGRKGDYCFKATTTSGYLTLSLPRVFALQTGDHPISADLTANGATTTVDVAEGDLESVGEGTSGGARSVLVEIRVTG